MRKVFGYLIVLFSILCVTGRSGILDNPSFEKGTSDYWISQPSRVWVDTGVSSHGMQSLCIDGNANENVDVVFFVPYETNHIWTIGYDVKGEGKRLLTIKVLLQDAKPIGLWEPSDKNKLIANAVIPTANWKRETFEFGPVPAEHAGRTVRKLGIYLRMPKSKERGRIWIDNITVSSAAAVVQQKTGVDIVFDLPDPVQIFEIAPDLNIHATGDCLGMELCVDLTDFHGKQVVGKSGVAKYPLKLTVPSKGYYKVSAKLFSNGVVIKEWDTSFVVTSPLADDYYDTPYPAFGVWGGLTPKMRRLGGAKWDRRLFFTHFQKEDMKATFPTEEEVRTREPVNVICCLNVLNPFKRMVPVAETNWPSLKKKLRNHIISRKELVDVWETQNEPMVGENFFGTMSDVVNIISNTSTVVRDVDPTTPIAGICINPMSKGQYSQYLRYYKKYNIDRYIDAVMLHPYIPNATDPDSSGYVETLNSLAEDLKKISGHDVPLYVSEIGYSTQPGGEVTELQQAAYLARVVLLNRRIKALKACVWHIGLWNDATSIRELCFSILRKHPKGSKLREPKPAFAAWATVSRMTYNAEYIRDLEMGRGVMVMLFKRNNKPLLVAYSLSPDMQKLKIPIGDTSAVLTDMCGTEEQKYCPNGILSLNVDEAPVYIAGGKWDNFANSDRFRIVFEPECPKVLPGKELNLIMRGSSEMWGMAASLDVELPEKWNARIKKKDNNSWNIGIKVPDMILPGEYSCFFKVTDNGIIKYVQRQSIKVTPIAELVSCLPVHVASGDNAVILKVKKYYKDTSPLFVDILEGKTSVIAKGFFANESSSTTIPLRSITYGRKNNYSARFMLSDGYQWDVGIPDIFPVKITQAEIDFELPLNSWPQESIYDLSGGTYSKHTVKGEMDIPKGKLYLCWDSRYLYIGAEIKDKYFYLAKNQSSLWNGDSLQIGISVKQELMIRANNDGIQETTYAEFGVMPQAGNHSWVWASMNRANMELHKEVPRLLNASLRKDDTTIYKIAVPWKSLNIKKPVSGMNLKLSILVNDRDGGRRHWLEWYRGIADGKNPDLYGNAVLY